MAAADRQVVRVEGRSITLSSLDKVMYPAAGFTKADVLGYIARVAPVLVPLAAGRPVTRKRWVHGVGTPEAPQPSFFAKQLEPGAPEWLRRVEIPHSDRTIAYPLIDDAAGLVWLAQSGALELHTPQWRAGTGERRPDRMVIDLDPGPGTGLAEAAAVALLVREILTGMGLDPVPVTSGSKGVHVYARIGDGMSTDQVSAVAHELARALEADHPGLVVSDMAKAKRGGKVLVDWSQNAGGKTTVLPYSLRGTWLPAVAAPRTWAELSAGDLRQLTPGEVLDRLDALGDLMAPLHDRAVPAATREDRAASAMRTAAPRTTPSTPATASRPSGTPFLPMLPSPIRGTVDPAHEWAVEMKWDGIRAIASITPGSVRLVSRSGADITAAYPELQQLTSAVTGTAVLDGEIVALDETGRPDFGLLQTRMGRVRDADARRAAARVPVRFLAFDLLELDGVARIGEPYRTRRAVLEQDVAAGGVLEVPGIVATASDTASLTAALAESRRRGLEGIVLKRTDSPYRPGVRTTDWLKVKFEQHVEVVVGGWWPGTAAEGMGSLLVGVPDGRGGLHFAGRVGTGFAARDRATIAALLTTIERADDPFTDSPAAEVHGVRFAEPTLVGEVRFTGWTRAGHLRHPVWRGWRTDRTPADLASPIEDGGFGHTS